MKKLIVLVALACLFVATSALAAAGPEGAWPCVGGNNQGTSSFPSGSPFGAVFDPGVPGNKVFEIADYATAPFGVRGAVLADEFEDIYGQPQSNIYLSVKDVEDSLQAIDQDGNLLWTISVTSGTGNFATGVIGNGGYWYAPCNGDGSGDYLIKIDTSDGKIQWTYVIGGGGKEIFGCAAMMDDAGDIYLRAYHMDSDNHAYLYKIHDAGGSASESWGGPVLVCTSNGYADPYDEQHHVSAIDPAGTYIYHYSGTPDLGLRAYAIADGSVAWSVPIGYDSAGAYHIATDHNPVVDDNGDVYLYTNVLDAGMHSGMVKFDGDTGLTLWTWDNGLAYDGGHHRSGCTGALSQDQSTIYAGADLVAYAGQQDVYAVNTTTGDVVWSQHISLCTQSNGQMIVDGGDGVIMAGGWNQAMSRRYPTDGAQDWYLDPLAGAIRDATANYCGLTARGELVLATERKSGGPKSSWMYVVKYIAEGPFAIYAPASIGPLNKDVPVRGTMVLPQDTVQPWIQFSCIGAEGPITYGLQTGSWPLGLTLNTATGQLTGAPTATGTYPVTVKADDGVNPTATRDYVIEVVAGPLRIGPGLPLASVGWPYSGGLWLLGGTPPYTVTVTAGKGDGLAGGVLGTTGLTMQSDGTITGTPTAIGCAAVEITVTDSLMAAVTRDITVDVVDGRVWADYQRTKRRVGTSTLPIPRSCPTIPAGGYVSADVWTWSYEMIHAPLFGLLESDPDADGVDNGYMFMSAMAFSSPPTETNKAKWAAAPYDVDPGSAYPDPTAFGGWVYSLTDNGWAGSADPLPGVLKLNGSYAERLYFANDVYYANATIGCLNADNGTLIWTISADASMDGDFEGPKTLLENGDLITATGQVFFTFYDWNAGVPGEWTIELESGNGLTYAVVRDSGTSGEIIWTAGELENPSGGPAQGPKFPRLSNNNIVDNSGYTSVMKLADEGEIVLISRLTGGNVSDGWTVRADKVQQYTLWTIGCGGDKWHNLMPGRGPTFTFAGLRTCPVIDSTNNIYIAKSAATLPGDTALRPAGLWAIDGVDAITNLDPLPAGSWAWVNSDPAITWYTPLCDGLTTQIPGSPCLSHDQRTLYAVLVPQGQLWNINGELFLGITVESYYAGAKAQLVALHTINGAFKWSKELTIGGKTGVDIHDGAFVIGPELQVAVPLADNEGKVICLTRGDERAWWETLGSLRNPDNSALNLTLRPTVWCVKDNGTDATVLWNREMSAGDAHREVGPSSFAVAPGYKLIMAGEVSPTWLTPGGGGYTRLEGVGVHLIHPDDIDITNIVWNQGTTSVDITFTSQNGVGYTIQKVDATEYSDGLAFVDGATGTASGTSFTLSDDLTANPLAFNTFRYYRVRRTDSDPFFSNGMAAVYNMKLAITFSMKDFFFGLPLVVHPNNKTVQGVLGTQINRTGPILTQHVHATGLKNRMQYNKTLGTWSAIVGSQFDMATGEAYFLNGGGGLAQQLPLRLVGLVPDKPVNVFSGKASFSVSDHWLCYAMPRARTLETCGLRQSVTGWNALNLVRLRPLGSALWTTYKWVAVPGQWEDVTNPGVPVDPPLACGEGIHFTRKGLPNSTNYWVQAPWYLHPPNAW